MVDDLELVALVVASRDQQAFTELVKRHEHTVRAMLARMTGNHALADDLAQETFLTAWRKIESFSGKGAFKGWLCRIAYTEFLQAHRKRKATQAVMDRFREVREVEEQVVHDWDSGTALDLDRALSSLSEAERVCIVLCYSVGLTHEEVAETTNTPLGTVKSHIRRGKEKMRTLLLASEPAR